MPGLKRTSHDPHEIKMNDIWYRTPLTVNMVVCGGQAEYRTSPPTRRRVNDCGHCGRFDVEEVVLHSWDEVVAAGWAVPT